MEIEVGNFIYSQETSNWTFKAKDQKPLDLKGNLKPKYKELPQFDIIYDIEAHHRGQMMNEIKTATKEILNILKSRHHTKNNNKS